MSDKKPPVGGVDEGHSPSKFKLPEFTKTDPEGSAEAKTSKAPMKTIPTTNVTPYGKGA